MYRRSPHRISTAHMVARRKLCRRVAGLTKVSNPTGVTRATTLRWCTTTYFSLKKGPKVVVVGPTDSGKSSLTKMLLGWATKQSRKPMFADLDLGQGSLSIPGTLAATVVDEPVDPVDGIPLEAPLVYFYGHTTASVNPDLYKSLVKELAKVSALQLERNPETRTAGLVINTMGWVKDLGYELLLHTIESFSANVILVLGQCQVYFRHLVKAYLGFLAVWSLLAARSVQGGTL